MNSPSGETIAVEQPLEIGPISHPVDEAAVDVEDQLRVVDCAAVALVDADGHHTWLSFGRR
jgi:hypothetical protein